MDSGLLNVFHDEPFDDVNYVNCDENDIDFWSSGSDTMGMQLAETLHGILPIAATDDAAILYSNTILKEDDYGLQGIDNNDDVVVSAFQTKHTTSIFEDFAEHRVTDNGSIEIITVDPNEIHSDETNSSDLDEAELEHFERNSQYSNRTFRSRTVSSSIGDYESHTSDYDDDDNYIGQVVDVSDDFYYDDDVNNYGDDDDDDDDEFDDCIINIHNGLCATQEYNMPPVPEAIAIKLEKESSYENSMVPIENPPLATKHRTISTNTTTSDMDGLDLNVDANTFDLAEFITKDDFLLAAPKNRDPDSNGISSMMGQTTTVQIISSKDADSDSDAIIDVETVEIDPQTEKQLWSMQSVLQKADDDERNNDEELNFEDNVNTDPSWSPKTTLVKKDNPSKDVKVKTTIANKNQEVQGQNLSRSFSLVPNRRQCDFLKGKFGTGRCKNASKLRKSKDSVTKSIESKLESTKPQTNYDHQPAEKYSVTSIRQDLIKPHTDTLRTTKTDTEVRGKDQFSIKRRRCSSLSESSLDKKPLSFQEKKDESMVTVIKHELTPQPQESTDLKSVKKKLNLEEYKQRRGVISNTCNSDNKNGVAMPTNIKLENIGDNIEQKNSIDCKFRITESNKCTVASLPGVISKQHSSTSVASIVQSLKAPLTQSGPSMDPITEAKKKVMRMQEQKKAKLLKIIDSTVSAKVPRVTKVLPLKDIVKDVTNDKQNSKRNVASVKTETDYEEIIIVSASSNTEISIPPRSLLPNCSADSLKHVNKASRSLLKSSALLYNISNTFQKVHASETVKITTNSLITSIQGVVAKKTGASLVTHASTDESLITALANGGEKLRSSKKCNGVEIICNSVKNSDHQHGEDKIIMHLRKDRIRNRTYSASVQTDILPEFPPLPLPTKVMERKSRERKRRRYRNHHQEPHSGASERDAAEGNLENFSSSDDAGTNSCRLSGSSERLRRHDAVDATFGGSGGGGSSPRSSRHYRSSVSFSSSSSSSSSDSSNSDATATHRSRKTYFKSSRSSRKYARSPSGSSIEYSDRSRGRKYQRNSGRRNYSVSRSRSRSKQRFMDRNVFQPAVEERRIVYVGRIEKELNKEGLRRKFNKYGPIKQITIHYKDTGMKYGFVTYERSQDAFAVIDRSGHDPQINMYDISFGGRRAFCRASYADLDNAGINTYQSYVFPQAEPILKKEDSFEALLLEVKAKMNANKSLANTTKSNAVKI